MGNSQKFGESCKPSSTPGDLCISADTAADVASCDSSRLLR